MLILEAFKFFSTSLFKITFIWHSKSSTGVLQFSHYVTYHATFYLKDTASECWLACWQNVCLFLPLHVLHLYGFSDVIWLQ